MFFHVHQCIVWMSREGPKMVLKKSWFCTQCRNYVLFKAFFLLCKFCDIIPYFHKKGPKKVPILSQRPKFCLCSDFLREVPNTKSCIGKPCASPVNCINCTDIVPPQKEPGKRLFIYPWYVWSITVLLKWLGIAQMTKWLVCFGWWAIWHTTKLLLWWLPFGRWVI